MPPPKSRSSYVLDDGSTAVFHITHVSNLPSLVESGFLYCDRDCHRDGRQPIGIAYTSPKEKRAQKVVDVGPGGTLGDYVPFYYAPRSPMLYAIAKGRVQGYTGGQDEVVHLVFRLEQLAEDGEFVMTNGHAIMAITRQFDRLEHGLAAIDDRACPWEEPPGRGC